MFNKATDAEIENIIQTQLKHAPARSGGKGQTPTGHSFNKTFVTLNMFVFYSSI